MVTAVQKAEVALAEPKIPAVYTSMLNILSKLGVAKTGTLPSNMGGKPYITAVDVSREVKTLFVEESLIALPSERVVRHESIILKDRINIAIAIEATYTFVSTKDGSMATVTGVGDGLAGGTAVASNIASTNALKNALLRTFLITEQSAEDAAKNGIDDEPKANRALDAARSGATTPATTIPNTGVKALQVEIKTAATAAGIDYVALGNGKYGAGKWANDITSLKAILKAIADGETP